MTERTTSDRRYQFLQALNRAIESVCNEVDARSSNAFYYRGRNLRFAVERALYFWAANDASLLEAFATTLASSGGDAAGSVAAAALRARLMPNGFMAAAPSIVRNGWESLRRMRALGRYLTQKKSRALSAVQASRTVETLFFLHHPKFVAYLQEVLGELGESAAICPTDHLGDFASMRPHRLVAMSAPRLAWQRAGVGLTGFPYFLQMFDMLTDTLRRERPSRAVVAEGNSPVDEIVNQAGATLGIPTVCIQQGWSPVVHAGFRNMTYSRMLVWGEGFAELLRPYNQSQRFDATGNPAISGSRNAMPDAERLAIAFFLQAPSPLIGDDSWKEFLVLAKWTAETFPQTKVLVREHPNHRLSADERASLGRPSNVKFVPPESESLAAVLAASSLIVTMYSSTIMESISVGVLPIIANLTSMPKYWPDVDAEGAAIEVRTTTEATVAITKCLTEPAYLATFELAMRSCSSRYFAARGRDAVENIVSSIRSTSENRI